MRSELGAMLQHEVKDPRIGFLSITRVQVSRDLAIAKVYVSTLDPLTWEASLTGLKSAAGFLRGEVARRLQLRHAPALLFRLDDTITESLRIQELLRVARQPSDNVPPAPPGSKPGE